MMRGPMRGGYLTEEEKANRPRVTGALLRRVFSYLKPYWKQLLLIFLAIAVSSLLALYPSILTGRIVDALAERKPLETLVRLILLSLAVTVGASLIGVAQNYLNTWIAQHIGFDMRNRMYAHLQRMSQRFFTTGSQGDIITRMTSDIDGVQRVITSTFASILSNVITLGAALAAMYSRSWALATLGVLIIPLFVIPSRRAGKTRWDLTRESQACSDKINGILNETLSVSGQMLVKLFGREEAEYERYREANERMIRLNIRESMAGRWFFMILSTFSAIGPMLIYLVGGILMLRYDASLTVGDITVMVALLSRLYGPVNSLLNMQVEWIRSMALFTRIFEYFDLPVEIEDAPDAVTPADTDGSVSFRHVRFAYEPERPILKDVSFELKAGASIALVGPSGSGKSTIINLIPRLYDAQEGQITFGGVDVKKLSLAFLRRHVGIVSQETYLFNGTIRDNLLYARPEATEAELMAACEKANIAELIRRQPEGLDALVGNRGLKLSGGEKQRLSIARVLLKDPALLIFDEATSALDSISEAKIQEAIEPLIAERTSILIAHRLSTVLAADEILVVKDGTIVERGQHADLVRAGGVYAELYETQFKRMREEEDAEAKAAD